VLTDIREGDVGAVLGWGFMSWSGGPFPLLDIPGAERAEEICDTLAASHGPRFEARALLRELAKTGESFYGRFQPVARAA
jgi:3-hydroxyacyl-CoA dehydrogenase/enoyl-CoA hydratase/3-hydroxybutyryl-CoA epimerase